MTTKNVENVRGEKESAIRILENEQRKYWHIIGQSDEKYGIGFIPLFREQYRDIANVKIEEAKQKLDEQQHVLENAFMVDFVAEINEAIREAKEEIDEKIKHLRIFHLEKIHINLRCWRNQIGWYFLIFVKNLKVI